MPARLYRGDGTGSGSRRPRDFRKAPAWERGFMPQVKTGSRRGATRNAPAATMAATTAEIARPQRTPPSNGKSGKKAGKSNGHSEANGLQAHSDPFLNPLLEALQAMRMEIGRASCR